MLRYFTCKLILAWHRYAMLNNALLKVRIGITLELLIIKVLLFSLPKMCVYLDRHMFYIKYNQIQTPLQLSMHFWHLCNTHYLFMYKEENLYLSKTSYNDSRHIIYWNRCQSSQVIPDFCSISMVLLDSNKVSQKEFYMEWRL